MKILLAEDQQNIRDLVTMVLVREGHAVVSVKDGSELLDLLRRGPGDFDVIVTDNEMPGGPSGIDALKSLRRDKRFEQVPIIVHTGSPYVEQEVQAQRGVYVGKGAGYQDLLQALATIEHVLRYRSHP